MLLINIFVGISNVAVKVDREIDGELKFVSLNRKTVKDNMQSVTDCIVEVLSEIEIGDEEAVVDVYSKAFYHVNFFHPLSRGRGKLFDSILNGTKKYGDKADPAAIAANAAAIIETGFQFASHDADFQLGVKARALKSLKYDTHGICTVAFNNGLSSEVELVETNEDGEVVARELTYEDENGKYCHKSICKYFNGTHLVAQIKDRDGNETSFIRVYRNIPTVDGGYYSVAELLKHCNFNAKNGKLILDEEVPELAKDEDTLFLILGLGLRTYANKRIQRRAALQIDRICK